jgi:hypothetical protein
MNADSSALEQAASAARPWQAAQGKTQARGGPRPGRRPPLLTASVRHLFLGDQGGHLEALG